MITFAIATEAILHFCCYIVGIIIGAYFCKILDLTKMTKLKNNAEFYFVYFVLTCIVGFVMGEFIFKLITLFI